jgi:hypothetical protein
MRVEAALAALDAHRRIAIYPFSYSLLTISQRLAPRSLVVKLAGKMVGGWLRDQPQ